MALSFFLNVQKNLMKCDYYLDQYMNQKRPDFYMDCAVLYKFWVKLTYLLKPSRIRGDPDRGRIANLWSREISYVKVLRMPGFTEGHKAKMS